MPTHQLVALGDVCVQDRTIAKAADQRPVLGLDQINSDYGTIHAAQGSKAAGGEGTYFVYDERHILFSKLRPYLNKVGKPTSSGRCSTELVPLLPNAKIVREYLFYLMRSPRLLEAAIASSTGARMPRANIDVLLREKIALPPLDEQQRIVDILDRAASIQRLRQAADEKLKQIIPALFVEMFGGTAQIKDRWPQMRLDEVADIGSGITKGRQIDPAEAIDVPYLRVANVQDGYLDMDEIKTITIRGTEQAKYALQHGDIVMTEGGDLDKLGRGYVWANELPYCAHQNHVFKVRPRQQLVSPYFLATYVGSPAGKDYFLRVAKRTTGIASINKTQLSALQVPVPPKALQQEFESKLCDLRSIQRLNSKATDAAIQTANAATASFFAM